MPNRGSKVRLGKNGKDYFAIIRDTKPTAILVETLFIDNDAELTMLKTDEGRKRCGRAIGKGLEKALAVQKRLSRRLRGEVIQIGAVKLDKNMNVCGSYQVIVKPKYFKKLHKHVSELTGITQEQMDVGTPLSEAAESFERMLSSTTPQSE